MFPSQNICNYTHNMCLINPSSPNSSHGPIWRDKEQHLCINNWKIQNAINGLIDVCRLPGTTKERTHSCLKASEWVSQGCGVCVPPWRMVDQKPHLTEGTGSQQACIKTSRAHSDTVRSRAYLECRILWRGWRIVRGETNNLENQSSNTASHCQSVGWVLLNGQWRMTWP